MRHALSLICTVMLVATAWRLIALSSHFGGADSYYFILYGYDLAQSAADTSFARYCYFPGAYQFWRVVAMAAGRNFAAYQMVFAIVGLANAALTGLIVREAVGRASLAALSACAYVLVGWRLEIDGMTTEPLVTLAALSGILLWLQCERRGQRQLGLLCLGAGYGLAVLTKQQGAFLALGAVGLVPSLWRQSRGWRRMCVDAVVVVATSLGVFAAGMALDGGGLTAVRFGIGMAADYARDGSFVTHLTGVAHRVPVLWVALVGAIGLWCPAWRAARRTSSTDRSSSLQVWSLGAATALVTLLQFTKRGYAHYALLTLPFALMAIAPAAAWSWTRVCAYCGRARGPSAPWRVLLCVSIGVIVVVKGLALEASAERRMPALATTLPHERDAALCDRIRPGQRLLLLPSRDNALHWACGTTARGTRWGYTFNAQETPEDDIAELRKPELTQVFVFATRSDDAYGRQVFARHDWSSFFVALTQQGFQAVVESPAGVLYVRVPAAADGVSLRR